MTGFQAASKVTELRRLAVELFDEILDLVAADGTDPRVVAIGDDLHDIVHMIDSLEVSALKLRGFEIQLAKLN